MSNTESPNTVPQCWESGCTKDGTVPVEYPNDEHAPTNYYCPSHARNAVRHRGGEVNEELKAELTKMSDHHTERDQHSCQRTGLELHDGNEVYINDRERPLAVVGSHERQQASGTWARKGEDKYHTVIELEGNGTEYHLLCTGGSAHGPVLYKESDWDDDKTNKIGLRPRYSRSGERVESLRVGEK